MEKSLPCKSTFTRVAFRIFHLGVCWSAHLRLPGTLPVLVPKYAYFKILSALGKPGGLVILMGRVSGHTFRVRGSLDGLGADVDEPPKVKHKTVC